MIVYRLKYTFFFIKVVVILLSTAPFLDEFSKECYGSASIYRNEAKLLINLGLFKIDKMIFILPKLTELFDS